MSTESERFEVVEYKLVVLDFHHGSLADGVSSLRPALADRRLRVGGQLRHGHSLATQSRRPLTSQLFLRLLHQLKLAVEGVASSICSTVRVIEVKLRMRRRFAEFMEFRENLRHALRVLDL